MRSMFWITYYNWYWNCVSSLPSLGFSKESTSSSRGRQMKTRRVRYMWMKCCELRWRVQPLGSPQCGYWYFSLVLVKYKWTVAQSLDFGHFRSCSFSEWLVSDSLCILQRIINGLFFFFISCAEFKLYFCTVFFPNLTERHTKLHLGLFNLDAMLGLTL